MGNVNSCYLKYGVSRDQFCGWEVSSLNPVTSDITVYCCYFEIKYEISLQLETYIKEVDIAGHVSGDCMYIIIKFLFDNIFVTMIICVRRIIFVSVMYSAAISAFDADAITVLII